MYAKSGLVSFPPPSMEEQRTCRRGWGFNRASIWLLSWHLCGRSATAARGPFLDKEIKQLQPLVQAINATNDPDQNLFACMRKYQLGAQRFSNKYCMVRLRSIGAAARINIEYLNKEEINYMTDIGLNLNPGPPRGLDVPPPQLGSWKRCISDKGHHLLRVCELKGSGTAVRISYRSRIWVPKHCFYISGDLPKSEEKLGAFSIPILAATVDGSLDECSKEFQAWSPEDQARFADPPIDQGMDVTRGTWLSFHGVDSGTLNRTGSL